MQHVGLSVVVVVDALSFIVPTVAVLLINVPLEEDRHQQRLPKVHHIRRILMDLEAGWQYVWENRVVAGVFLVTTMNLLATGVFSVAFAPFVRHVLHGSAGFYSWCLTLQGLSGIAGALSMGVTSKLAGPRVLLSGGLISLGLLSLLEVLAARQPVTLGVSLLVEPPSEVIGASQNALLQARTADVYRGRVSGAYGTTWSGTLLLSTVATTLITDGVGIRTVLIGGSQILALAGLAALNLPPRSPVAYPPSVT